MTTSTAYRAMPSHISHAQLLEALQVLGIDPNVTVEVHIGIPDLTVVHYALDENGKRYFDPVVPDMLARTATTYRIGDQDAAERQAERAETDAEQLTDEEVDAL